MTDNGENLILEHLRALGAGQDSIEAELKEVKHRLTGVEIGMVGVRRDNARTLEDVHRQQAVIDAIQDRLQRIGKRLELI